MTGRHEGFFNSAESSPPEAEPPVVPRPPAPRGRPKGAIALVLVVMVALGVGVADHLIGHPATPPAPAPSLSSVPAANVESSSWYCVGGTSAPGSAAASTLDIVNTTRRAVGGVMRVVGDNAHVRTQPIVVGPGTQIVSVPGPLVGGNMVAATLSFSGGGVLVSQSASGPLGWSETSCSRSTATQWYFASGATEKGDTLTLALYNPTSAEAVVDTTFVTPSGLSQPQPFEGIVVAPGAVVAEHIDAYVQDATSVSTIVEVRGGAVVAAQLQTESVGSRGVSVRLGEPVLSRDWALPRTIDGAGPGASTAISVFNPTESTERVSVVVRPGISPLARFTRVIAPRTTWVFDADAQTRIPTGLAYLATVRVMSGPGVVVDRTVIAPGSAQPPQFGAVNALAFGLNEPNVSGALLPGPGTEANPAVEGAEVDALNLYNPGTAVLRATVWALEGAGGRQRLVSVEVRAGATISIGRDALESAGRVPIEVGANRPVLVLEDLTPSATAGVVSLDAAGSASP